MYHFRMVGIIKDSDTDVLREILYKHGKLSGDRTLIKALKEQARIYIVSGNSVAGYSPSTEELTRDAMAVIMLMREVCHQGEIWGNYPEWR
ncbi:hypothetical protein [Neobacillus drentensis]|uniref:hypothetical protein n=1 Tax=Neobacillus drentensis TaxID=220684 RepID=UPI002FFF60C9